MIFQFVFTALFGFMALWVPTLYQLVTGERVSWVFADALPIAATMAVWFFIGWLDKRKRRDE